MDTNWTTMSGRGLTLITTQGGQPVSRKTVEAWWESTKATVEPAPAPPLVSDR
jgi:hypothetical protein